MFTQNLRGRLERDRQVRGTDRSEGQTGVQVCFSPVCLPDVDGLGVVDAMFLCHVVQEVEEESDCNGRRTLRTEDRHEDVVHKLLQRSLQRDRQVERQTVRERETGTERDRL